jgi:two-component system nitrate/nitrite response regulator NarL
LLIELVDDHAIVRSGLRLLIESHLGWTVVAEAGSALDAIAAAAREQPDIILLDLCLGEDDGLDCLQRLRQAAPHARVLILTALSDPEVHAQAARLGAAGILGKDNPADSLLNAIERVHAGEMWFDQRTTASLLGELASRSKAPDPNELKIQSLTKREREVIALVTEGLRNKQIATRLRISEATVRHHLTSIFAKLEVADRLGLTIYAFRHGFRGNGWA